MSGKILVVDDSLFVSEYLYKLLVSDGYDVVVCNDGRQTLSKIREHSPDLILLDLIMKGVDGYSICRQIKDDASFSDIPVIFITSSANSENIARGFQVGASDYISKPFNKIELFARVRCHYNSKLLANNFRKYQLEIEAKNRMLEALLRKNQLLAITDSLTSLFNRSHINTILGDLHQKKVAACFAMLDLDLFKSINDTYGHTVGDEVLVAVGKILSKHCTGSISCGRWGGEEFVVIFDNYNLAAGVAVLTKIKQDLENWAFTAGKATFHVTATMGICVFDHHDSIIKNISKADVLMYYGKKHGRNRIITPAQNGNNYEMSV